MEMDFAKPGCSAEAMPYNGDEENNDLQEIYYIDGIDVWGENQETLENEVLEQIKILSEERFKKEALVVEEGQIVEKVEDNIKNNEQIIPQKNGTNLDIHKFIQRQEELKKKQQIIRQMRVSEHSRKVAENISNQQFKRNSKKTQVNKNIKSTEKKKEKIKYINSNTDGNLKKKKTDSDSDYVPSCDDVSDTEYSPQQKNCKRKRKFSNNPESETSVEIVKDDGDLNCFKERLNIYYEELELQTQLKTQNEEFENSDEEIEDYFINESFKIPKQLWRKLYSYQQDGVEWLWKIHDKQMGGLLGDEMGLGKTVQVIAFLAALNHSKHFSKHGRYKGLGATLIVCPVTVIHQWVKHFHEWWPEFRVAVLHQSGSCQGDKVQLIKEINKSNCILITTYLSILKYKVPLSESMWHYIILDEGHCIRNPTTQITVAIKRLMAEHRLLLTGSPMQNNLQELWSLFDFISPGILGTQQVFSEHFSNPIMQGGYKNASSIQEATALSVATTLKEIISPHMLRRAKADVHKSINLPHKSEQVLFCSLTEEQTDLYKGYIMSDRVNNILGKRNCYSENQTRANMLIAITTLRKICNHPDLYIGDSEDQIDKPDEDLPVEDKYGYYKRSGKMVVVAALLKIWKRQGHRVLLFTQSRGMIAIFESFLNQQNYKYLKMDGSTNISSRQRLIDTFNQDNTMDVFLLTTRVGGLGVNLTGANRVIIYDPDWNPAIDTQARERAWRIGQRKQVTIYRLLSAGTIEEKMYQRQVWKQLLSNKVLIDPRTQRIFKTSDLYDLFSLQEPASGSKSETENIFKNSKVELDRKDEHTRKRNNQVEASESSEILFDEEKIKSMHNMAQKIAKSMSQSMPGPKKNADPTKAKSKEFIKTLTPIELREWNRKKDVIVMEDPNLNRVDDSETNVSFEAALSISENKANLYKNNKLCCNTKKRNQTDDKTSHTANNSKKSTRKPTVEEKIEIDKTGLIDGEKIECLVKREVNKNKNTRKVGKKEDDYVLKKLFSKSGVSTALEHDVIVQSGYKNSTSFKIRTEAQNKADLALNAVRKSRLNNWNW